MRICSLLMLFVMSVSSHSWSKTDPNLDNFYLANQSDNFKCSASGESIRFETLLPRDFELIRAHQKLPLIIVFDEQNQSIYKNTLNTIDYLTSLSNMPSSCVLGIGFQDGMQRFMLSNYSSEPASLEPFLKDIKELAENQLKENGIMVSNIIVIGHSRTGYSAQQFLFNYPAFITAAITGSAQDISSKKEVAIFERFIATIHDQKLKRYYLFSSGKEKWGDGDEMETTNMLSFFEKYKDRKYFISLGQQYDCDHYNSLGYGLNSSLSFLFQGHNFAMQEAFKLLNSGTKLNYLKEDYSAIYQQVSDSTGIYVEMDVSFYVSLFYGYLNDYFGHYESNKTANAQLVIDEAIARFNTDYRYTIHYATLLYELGEMRKAEEFWTSRLGLLKGYKWKDEKGIIEELAQFDELINQE